MSFKLVKQVVRSQQASPAHKLVMIVIADHTNENATGTAWPAVDTIANYVGLSRRQVQRILRELEATGQIKVWKKNAQMGTNRYQIVIHNVTPMSPPRDTHVTPNVTFMTSQRDTHVTRVYKEQINNRAGGAPRSAQGASALPTNEKTTSDRGARAEARATPECPKHPYHYDSECDTCYTWQQSETEQEQTA